MNEPQNKQCEMLSAWLKVATDGLCDDAKTRIALEIEAHFNDAVAARLVEAKSLEEAQATTLQELGDAKVAAKRFERKHLTIMEYDFIQAQKASLQRQDSTIKSFCRALIICSIFGLLLYWSNLNHRELVVFLGFVLFHTLIVRVCRRLVRSLSDQRAVKWLSFIVPLSTIFSLTAAYLLLYPTGDAMVYGLIGAMLIDTCKWLSVFVKLSAARFA